jgi:hypothetical protein
MTLTFKKATKEQARARIGLIGPSGSGKTYTALTLAHGLGQRIALIDTERGSASKYAHRFTFDVLELAEFDPRTYVAAIQAASEAGYQVLVIDSLSHAWTGKGGALELKDAAAKRNRGDSFSAWRDITPLHNALVDAILQAPMHVIVTLRAKTEYAMEKDDRTGKTSVRKIGLAPVQRDGLEYEFDIVGDLDADNTLVVTKTRCEALSGKVINRPGAELAAVVAGWLQDGTEPTPPPAPVEGLTAERLREEQAAATATRNGAAEPPEGEGRTGPSPSGPSPRDSMRSVGPEGGPPHDERPAAGEQARTGRDALRERGLSANEAAKILKAEAAEAFPGITFQEAMRLTGEPLARAEAFWDAAGHPIREGASA